MWLPQMQVLEAMPTRAAGAEVPVARMPAVSGMSGVSSLSPVSGESSMPGPKGTPRAQVMEVWRTPLGLGPRYE